jgi:hypothetical protein
MKMKYSSVILAVVVIAVIVFVMCGAKSNYMLGYPVTTNISDSKFSNFFSKAFESKLGPQLKCNPGSADMVDPKTGKRQVMSAYYTGGLTPGGFCDDQEVVRASMDYKLVGKDAPLGE